MLSPINAELRDARFVGEDGAARVGNEGGRFCIGPFLLWESLVEYIVDVVADANELLGSIANSYDDSSDTYIRKTLQMS